MDKIKTIVINESEVIQDTENDILLTDEFIELIPSNMTARYLKMNIYFKNHRKNNAPKVPFVKINGELCPIMIQQDFEIKSEDDFQIESLMINNDFDFGHIVMILANYRENK